MKRLKLLVAFSFVASSALFSIAGSAQAIPGQIEGSGSTWSEVIVQQWIADEASNGLTVVYSGTGSSAGRKDFANSQTDFGISEIPYQGTDELGQSDSSNGRAYAYLPIVAGGTSFTYQVQVGGKWVRDLRLSGETLAKIFTLEITNWNDPAITKDNNGRKLPSLAITPVVRSDGSGTTAQFTTWMDKTYPSIWHKFYGKSGLTSYYPRKGRMIAASGSDQVMNTIASSAGNGTIGYIEYSYPLNKTIPKEKYHAPVVKVLNQAGYYVEPTQYNVAVALTKAKVHGISDSMAETDPNYLTQDLTDVYTNADPRAYPLSSYSYMIIPTGADDRRMKGTTKAQILSNFLTYSLCEGQSKAGPYGYSPLPLNLVQAGYSQIEKMTALGATVSAKDITKCANPTFDGSHPDVNKLAQIAPQPAACDKTGAGPCPAEGAAPASTATAAPTTGGTSETPPTTDPTAPPAPAATTDVPATTGGDQVVDDTVLPAAADAVPTELSATRKGDRKVFGWLAAAELLLLVIVPPGVALVLRNKGLVGGAR